MRRGKGGQRREVGMDGWAWDQIDPWLEIRRDLPIGAVLCVIHGPTAGPPLVRASFGRAAPSWVTFRGWLTSSRTMLSMSTA